MGKFFDKRMPARVAMDSTKVVNLGLNNECKQREDDAAAAVSFVPQTGRWVVVSHVCACGHRLTREVSALILDKIGKNFPNTKCPKCPRTTFGSSIISVDSELANLSKIRYDPENSEFLAKIIESSEDISAVEDPETAAVLEESFASISQFEGCFVVQPHFVSRAGRSLTSSNWIDLSSALDGFEGKNRRRVVFLEGPSLSGKVVETLAVQSLLINNLGTEGVQLEEIIPAADGLVGPIFAKTDAYFNDIDGEHPVEMFLGNRKNTVKKLRQKLSQLSAVVMAECSAYGFLLNVDFRHWDISQSRFSLVKIKGADLRLWAARENRKIANVCKSVSHLLEDSKQDLEEFIEEIDENNALYEDDFVDNPFIADLEEIDEIAIIRDMQDFFSPWRIRNGESFGLL